LIEVVTQRVGTKQNVEGGAPIPRAGPAPFTILGIRMMKAIEKGPLYLQTALPYASDL